MSQSVETPRRSLTSAALPALFAAALAGLGALALVGRGRQAPAPVAIPNCILGENAAAVGGAIDLVDHNGARVTQADFAGEPAVLYFGFTHCPDVCPLSLNLLGEALALPGGYDLQAALISLDPARDTPAVMGAYVRSAGFPAGLRGLTGTQSQVESAKRAFQVYGARDGGGAGSYGIDHSSMIYVLDRQWRTVAIMPTVVQAVSPGGESRSAGAAPGDIAACIAAGLATG
jgi:protein SCO1